jgi:signal transduction histidine kinase
MKHPFQRTYFVVFLLIVVLGLLFTGITYFAITNFYEASTQLLNKDVATHIARFTSPYGREGFDRRKADSVFYDAMVISPSAEVYFLDTLGRVIYFHGKPEEIKEWQVGLEPIRRYLAAGGGRHVVDVDPRDPKMEKIFSVAAVEGEPGTAGLAAGSGAAGGGGGVEGGAGGGSTGHGVTAGGTAGDCVTARVATAGGARRLGYIYVILGSQQYRSVTQMLFNSRITPMVLGAVSFLLAVSLLITVYTIQRMRERDNLRRITASEKERRDFMVNISHDLRTPLAIARGYTETLLLKKGELSAEEEQGYGDLALAKLRQVEKMVNQLFELSKMESASFEAYREPFVFSEMMQEVVSSLGGGRSGDVGLEGRAGDGLRAGAGAELRAGEGLLHGVVGEWRAGTGLRAGAGSRIELINGEDGSWIEADVSMMERVVQNLVVNALAYTPAGGAIRIRLSREIRAGREVEAGRDNRTIREVRAARDIRAGQGGEDLVFTISNAGAPLADDLVAWLNGDEGAMRPSAPAIGLSIVRRILWLHRYTWKVDVGAGVNTFTIRMPVYKGGQQL